MSQRDDLEEKQYERRWEADDLKQGAEKAKEAAKHHLDEAVKRKKEGEDEKSVKRAARRTLIESEKAKNAAKDAEELVGPSQEAADTAEKIANATGNEKDKSFSDNMKNLANETKEDSDSASSSANEAQKHADAAKQVAELGPADEKFAADKAVEESN